MTADRDTFHSVLRASLGLALLVAAILLALGLWRCDGRLIFGLDDAYIHLAMGEEIARLNYGVNPGEIAAASSSPLYPLLLAPLAGTGLQLFLPLIWNLLALLLSVALLAAIFTLIFEARRGLAIAATVATSLAFNLPGQPLLGMEHGLQIAATLSILAGLIRLARDNEWPGMAGAALVLGPLLRYENLALSLATIGAIAWLGQRRLAGLLAIAVLAPMLGFTIFLLIATGHVLPNPVLIKSGLFGSDIWNYIVERLVLIRQREAIFAGLLTVALAAIAWQGRDRGEKSIALVALSCLLAQIFFGGFDVLGRRAAYANIFGWMALLWLARGSIADWAERFGLAGSAAIIAATLAVATPNTALALLSAPQAQRNVYEQQYQMRRLAVDFIQAPVAVNDLGFVSWRNDKPALDLAGMGSLEARRGGQAWIISAIEARGVEAALVYEPWFAPPPPGWVKLGEFSLSGQNVNLGGPTVAVFATRPQAVPKIRQALQAFFATLPPGVRYRAF